jgi:hypothetical protein
MFARKTRRYEHTQLWERVMSHLQDPGEGALCGELGGPRGLLQQRAQAGHQHAVMGLDGAQIHQ